MVTHTITVSCNSSSKCQFLVVGSASMGFKGVNMTQITRQVALYFSISTDINTWLALKYLISTSWPQGSGCNSGDLVSWLDSFRADPKAPNIIYLSTDTTTTSNVRMCSLSPIATTHPSLYRDEFSLRAIPWYWMEPLQLWRRGKTPPWSVCFHVAVLQPATLQSRNPV